MMQLDPCRSSGLPRPDGWSDSVQASLLSMVHSHDIQRLTFQQLYDRTYPNGLIAAGPAARSPSPSIPHLSSPVPREGKSSEEQERKAVVDDDDPSC
jgi:hypothetical protein